MTFEVLTIGDEVLSGVVVDTNFAWLADQLWTRGLDLARHATVGDEEARIGAALLEAAGRAGTVLVTGGLGPTADDITLASAARAFGLDLVLHEPSVEHMRALFARAGRPMADANLRQAMLPAGAVPIANPDGTTPGCRLAFRGTDFVFLPGVPREMKAMVEASVLPWLATRVPEAPVFAARVLRCFGLAEATVHERLAGLDLLGADLAFRPVFPEVLLKVSARGGPGDAVPARVDEAAARVRAALGRHVYGEGDASLPAVLGALLQARGERVGVVEAGTGGVIAEALAALPGSEAFFAGAMIAASADPADLPPCGAGTPGLDTVTAIALAEAARRGATWGLATLGMPEPGGGTPDRPGGTILLALAGPDGTTCREHRFGRGRDWFRRLGGWSALDLLRRRLEDG